MSPQPTRSESVYLDAVALDGRTGFVARLGRYPHDGVAWVWAHVFGAEGCVSYNDSRVACDALVVAADAPDARYATADDRTVFERHGRRDAIIGGSLVMAVDAHEGSTAPDGPGPVPLTIDASFAALGVLPGAGNLPGRTEEHGVVRVRATWPGGGLELEARGQWHEQHQDTPRFTVPFTYVTVRGDATSLVAIIGRSASGGIFRSVGDGTRATSVTIASPGDERVLTAALDDGRTVAGVLRATHCYAVPIDGRPRPGTLVAGVLDGEAVSGCVNDWEPSG